jgi:hypothetical protein
MRKSSASGTIHHLAMVATEEVEWDEVTREQMASADEGRYRVRVATAATRWMSKRSASGTIHHLAMVATDEVERHEVTREQMASADEGRSLHGSHRSHAVDEEKFRVRNNPPSGDGGYRRSGMGRSDTGTDGIG